jgi:hypothetical protein
MRLSLLLFLTFGCASKVDDIGSQRNASGPWSVVADDIEGGALLSAWSDGDTLRMVGGDLGGGPSIAVHGDDEALCIETNLTERALWWIHGDRPGRWAAVGEAGIVLLEEDGVRTRLDIDTDATLFGVWVESDAIWAVGGHVGGGENDGAIWRYQDDAWTEVASDLPGVLFKLWPDWAVGQDSLLRLTDAGLEEYPMDGRLLTVHGRSSDDVWAVGGLTNAIVKHFDGTDWTDVHTAGLGQPVNGVVAAEDTWIGGNYGLTARWTGSDWELPDTPLSSDHLHAVWRHADATWWVGGDLFNAGDNHGTILRHGETLAQPKITDCE